MGAFSKKDKLAIDQRAISTLISEGSTINGNMDAPAFARIDGHVIGDVTIAEGLILGEKGFIEGNVITKEMVIYGAVNGNITVSSIEIKATGKISGDIRAGSLAVETGGVYNGSVVMTTDSPS